jgi:hypothetical protein
MVEWRFFLRSRGESSTTTRADKGRSLLAAPAAPDPAQHARINDVGATDD